MVDTSGMGIFPADAAAARIRALRAAGIAYLAAVVASEATVAFVGAAYGVLCHAVVLIALLAFTVLEPEPLGSPADAEAAPQALDVLPVLALVPLLRIVSLTMPLPALPELYWYGITGATLLLALALTGRFFSAEWSRETFAAGWSRAQALVGLSGLPLGLLAYVVLRPEPLYPHLTPQLLAVGCLVLFLFNALTEELLFRGVLQRVLIDLFGKAGVVAAAGLFVVTYVGTRSAPYVVLIALVGLAFGRWVQVSGSLAGVVVAHALLSIGLVLVWPYVLS